MSSISAPFGNAEPLDFSSIVRKGLCFLHSRLGFDLWMVTRVEGDDWIILEAEDHGYGVKLPAVFRWKDSFCSRMVQGLGPPVAPCSSDVPVYTEAPIGQQMPIGAYIGVPLRRSDGSLFGTLCAIDPSPQPASIEAELPLVEMMATMLSALLVAEMESARLTRKVERALAEAETDALSGIYNRRGWDRLAAMEEARCRRFGHPACVIAVDLDRLKETNDAWGHTAGDDLIARTARVLREAVRKQDVVARVGGDEFLVLGIECDPGNASTLVERIRRQLGDAHIEASIGMSLRSKSGDLDGAVLVADEHMFADKRERQRQAAIRQSMSLLPLLKQ